MTLARLLAAAAALAAASAAASAQTIVSGPVRLGNNTENMTYVSGGRWEGLLAAADGYDVIGIKLRGRSPSHGAKDSARLFDVKPLGFAPRGIAWVPPLGKFVYSSPFGSHVNSLFTSDDAGTGFGKIPLTHLAEDANLIYIEGVTWIPPDAPAFGNHLAFILVTGDALLVRFATLDGTVVGGFTVPEQLADFIGAIDYRASTGRLGTAHGADYWECTFQGVCDGPLATFPDATSIESVVALPDGRIAAADYGMGRVQFLGRDNQVEEGLFRDFRIGLGISRPLAQAWDSARNEILLFVGQGQYESEVVAIPSAAGPVREVVDLVATGQLAVRGLTHVASSDTIAGSLNDTIYSYSPAGELVSSATTAYPNINGLGDVAAEDRFVIKTGGNASTRLRFVDRAGAKVAPDVFLAASPNGQRIAAFGPAGNVRFAAGNRIYSRDGALLTTVTAASVGMMDLTTMFPITSGPLAGKWIGFDGQHASEMVIFELP